MKRIASVDNCLVLIIGSTSSPLEKPIFLDLVKNKCIVRRQYIEAIHEIYQLADLYVFPVEERLGSIEVPLSVLEAMASNLPVISTKFCGLPRMFKEGDGLFFVDNRNEIPKLVGDIIDGNIIYNLDTRSKVLPYSWENISRILCQYYQELVDG
jgi:glycosyltransferase involved in cell wall biosynthesis